MVLTYSVVEDNNNTPTEYRQEKEPPRKCTRWSLLCDMHGDLGRKQDAPAAAWVRPHLWDFRIDVFWLLVAQEGMHHLGLTEPRDTLVLPMVQLDRWRVSCSDAFLERRFKVMLLHNFGSDYVCYDTITDPTSFRMFVWHISVIGDEPDVVVPWLHRLDTTCAMYICIDEDFAFCRDPVVRGIQKQIGWEAHQNVSGHIRVLKDVSDQHRPNHTMQCIPRLQQKLLTTTRRPICPHGCELADVTVNRVLGHLRGAGVQKDSIAEWIQFSQQGETSGRGVKTNRITTMCNLVKLLNTRVKIVHLNLCISPEWTHTLVHEPLTRMFNTTMNK